MSSFHEVFAAAPTGAARVPGRVNLIGEHIDYTGGLVLPTPIDRQVTVQLAPHTGPVLVQSSRFETIAARDLADPINGHWSDYALAAHRKAVAEGLADGGVKMWIDSDVPHGAGVSSSAALIVAVLKAHADAAGQNIEPVTIARWAQQVETDDIGVPCGIMDQMAVAAGQEGYALALATDTLATELVPLFSGHRFVVLHSGIGRALADGQYKNRRQATEMAKQTLAVSYLSHASMDQLEGAKLNEEVTKRARHTITEHQRSLAAVEALRQGNAQDFGALMNASHASMNDDFEIVPTEMDVMCTDARALGALGARLTGGGFGGCFVCLVEDRAFQPLLDGLRAAHPSIRFVAAPHPL